MKTTKAYLVEPLIGTIRIVAVPQENRLAVIRNLIGCDLIDMVQINETLAIVVDDNGLQEALPCVTQLHGYPSPLAGNLLIVLMALAGHQHHVLGLGLQHRLQNRRTAVRQNQARGLGGQTGLDVGQDLLGRLVARVVAGDDHAIGQARGDGAHLRTLGTVAIAAAAKGAQQPAATRLRQRAQGLQRLFQCIRRVGVINDQLRQLAAIADPLHAARHRRCLLYTSPSPRD